MLSYCAIAAQAPSDPFVLMTQTWFLERKAASRSLSSSNIGDFLCSYRHSMPSHRAAHIRRRYYFVEEGGLISGSYTRFSSRAREAACVREVTCNLAKIFVIWTLPVCSLITSRFAMAW